MTAPDGFLGADDAERMTQTWIVRLRGNTENNLLRPCTPPTRLMSAIKLRLLPADARRAFLRKLGVFLDEVCKNDQDFIGGDLLVHHIEPVVVALIQKTDSEDWKLPDPTGEEALDLLDRLWEIPAVKNGVCPGACGGSIAVGILMDNDLRPGPVYDRMTNRILSDLVIGGHQALLCGNALFHEIRPDLWPSNKKRKRGGHQQSREVLWPAFCSDNGRLAEELIQFCMGRRTSGAGIDDAIEWMHGCMGEERIERLLMRWPKTLRAIDPFQRSWERRQLRLAAEEGLTTPKRSF